MPANALRRLDCLQYEDRTLFSATPMGAELLVQAAADTGEAVAAPTASSETEQADASLTSTPDGSSKNGSTAAAADETSSFAPTTTDGYLQDELVFVDTSISNYQQLLDDLAANADESRRFHIVLLDPSQDGMQQITAAISQYGDLSAIHFVTHASDGALRLGDARLTAANFDDYSQQISLWRASLTDDADLLFYGCELAGSAEGRALLAGFEQATGADVAASTDNTGNALLGANWRLEFTQGIIETGIAFSSTLQQQWMNVLNVAIDNVSSAIGNASTTVTISHITTGTERLMLVGISIDPHGDTINSVTYNGDSLTFIGAVEPGGGHSRVEIWALVAPDLGMHDVEISVSGTSYNGLAAGVITFTGVDQSTPYENFATNSGTSTAASVTVASRANDIVFGVVHVHETGTNIVGGGGQTEQWDLNEGETRGSGSTAAGAASVNNTWTVGNDDWTAAGISVRAVPNTAPVLSTAASPALSNINEDAGAPVGAVGTLISSLVDFNSPAGQVDNVTDPDASALLGIAVTAADTTNGSWWYSTDNGSNWNSLGAVADNNARLLAADANTRIYFQPNANYSGTVSSGITFRAWDQSSGTNGALANTSTNGGTTAFSTATDTAAVTVSAVNDAPTNSVPGAQSTNEVTALVFSSGNGNQISIADVDAGGTSVQVTLTATNGTITLSALTGLSFSTGDGSSDTTMTFTGTIADINTALNGLGFTPTPYFNGNAQLQIATNDQGNSGAGGPNSDTDTIDIAVNPVNHLVLSTAGTVGSPSGAPGLNSWTAGQELNFGGSNLSFEPGTTSGSFSAGFDLSSFASDGAARIDAIHVVSGNITVGTTTPISLLAGDLLLSSRDNETLIGSNTLTVTREDVFVFRPDVPGNYSSGTFILFIQGGDIAPNHIQGIALAEQDTVVGGVSIAAGDVLFTQNGVIQGSNIYLFRPTSLGINTTGSVSILIDGGDIGINGEIADIHLVENDTYVGGKLLQAGRLLVAFMSAEASVGSNNVAVAAQDIVILNVSVAGTNTSATAERFFEGADVGLDTSNEAVRGVALSTALVVANQSPTATDESYSVAEGGTLNVPAAGVLANDADPDGDPMGAFVVTAPSYASAFTLNADGSFTYVHDGGETTSDSFTYLVSDGHGGTATATTFITINPVNDAPVNGVPAAQSTTEDTTLVFSSGNGNQISIADIDAGSSSVQVTLTATNGMVSLNGVVGLAFSVGDGTADGTMTFTGSVADINTALNGLTFTPTNNFNGAASLQIITNDQGNTGSGGAQSDIDSVAITVNAVNDAPTNTVPGAQSTDEDTTLVFSSGNGNQISIADVDAGLSSVRVTLTATNGAITLNGVVGLAFSVGDGTADGTMTFTGSVADINTALNGLSFTPTGDFNGAASLQIVTNDQGNTGSGGAQSDSDSVAITVNAVNDAPVNTVPGAQSTDEDTTLVFSSGNGNQISIADVDAGSSSVQVTLTATNGTITLNGMTGLSFSTGDGTADGTMTFTGTVADVNTALNGLSFTPTGDFNGAANLQIVTNDQGNTGSGGAQSDSDSVAITVNAVNDTPVLTIPGTQNTPFQTALTFSSTNGNPLVVSDVDAGSSTVRLTITPQNGTITLVQTAGLTFLAGTGTGDSLVTVEGSLADLNAALNGLTFTPDSTYRGATTIALSLDDLGNSGSGGSLVTAGQVDVVVAPSSQRIQFSGPTDQAADNFEVIFSSANGNALQFSDAYGEDTVLDVTITATNGTVTLATTQGLTFTSGSNGASSMSFTGTISSVNAALDGTLFSTTVTHSSLSVYGTDLPRDGMASHTAGGLTAVTQPAIYPAPTPQTPVVETIEEIIEAETELEEGAVVLMSPAAMSQPPHGESLVPRAKSSRAEIFADPSINKGGLAAMMKQEKLQFSTAERETERILVSSQIKSLLKIERPALRSQLTAAGIPWSRAEITIDDRDASSLSDELIVGTAGITASLSVGYVLWSIRAATLLSTMLSSMPAWQSFDPLPVITHIVEKKVKSPDDDDDDADELF